MTIEYSNVVILIILFFLVPIIITGIGKKSNLDFKLNSLVYLLNWSIILQVIVALFFFLIFIVYGEEMVHKVFSRQFHTNMSFATVWFIIIAGFYYMPCLAVLNLINLIMKRKKASS